MTAVSAAAATLAAVSPPPPRPPRQAGVWEALSALARAPAGVKAALAALVARNTLATGAFSVLSVIFARNAGLSELETGAALAVNPLVQAALASPVSRATRGREPEAYAAGIALTGAALHLYLAASSLPAALAAQAVLGVAFSLIQISVNNYVISRMPEHLRYTASSLFPLAFNAGWITGTGIGGPAMDAWGVGAWLALAGALEYALAAATLAALRLAEARGGGVTS